RAPLFIANGIVQRPCASKTSTCRKPSATGARTREADLDEVSGAEPMRAAKRAARSSQYPVPYRLPKDKYSSIIRTRSNAMKSQKQSSRTGLIAREDRPILGRS